MMKDTMTKTMPKPKQSHRGPAFLWPVLIAILLLCVPLEAKEAPPAWILPPNDSYQQLIPLPPVPGSPAAQADLDAVLALQDHPTKAELDHAEATVGFTVFTYRESLGEVFSAAIYPKTAGFFQQLGEVANARKNYLKDIYKRERPYKAFPGLVKELVTEEHGWSYPSGHSTRAWLFALVLGTLDPPHRNAFLCSAMTVCNDRVLGGMHYPSDMMASRVLAEALYRDLMKDPSFQKDLESLRQSEWSRKTDQNH